MWRTFVACSVLIGLGAGEIAFANEDPRTPLDICLETLAAAGSAGGKAAFWSAVEGNAWTDDTRRGFLEWFAVQSGRHGAPRKSRFLAKWGDGRGGVFEIRLRDDQTIRGSVVLSETKPGTIRWLHMAEPLPWSHTAGGVLRAAGITPDCCSVSLCAIDIGPRGTRRVVGINADRRAYIASLHKLFVLRALSEAVRAEGIQWDSILRTRPDLVSGGTGLLQDWPLGAPVTVQTLATLMIGESDNMATDHLIHRLSRRAVERAMPGAGSTTKPDSRNRPYLFAAEAFELRAAHGKRGAKLAAEYVKATESERLRLLTGVRNDAGRSVAVRPAARQFRDKIGWFASPMEICQSAIAIAEVCGWDTSDAELEIMRSGVAKYRVLPVARSYAAVKAGVGSGHRSRFALIKSKLGRWHAICLILNGEERAVEAVRLNDAFEHLSFLLIAGTLGKE